MLDAAPVRSAPSSLPMATPDDVRWAGVKARAARWFARLEADEARNGRVPRPSRRVDLHDVPEADPNDVVEVTIAGARSKARSS
jgi:hypothetical protein